jgi:hypothetical protein
MVNTALFPVLVLLALGTATDHCHFMRDVLGKSVVPSRSLLCLKAGTGGAAS